MQKRYPRTIPLYDKANWGDIRQNIIEIFEHYLQLNDQFDRSVDKLAVYKTSSFQLADQFIPVKTQSTKIHILWLTPAIKHLINKKLRIYRKAKQFQNPHNWQVFKDLQREIRSCLRRQHWKYINNIITTDNGINKNKLFWHYIKGERQDKTGIIIFKLPHCEVTDPIEKAEK